jgi:hypothetical protein
MEGEAGGETARLSVPAAARSLFSFACLKPTADEPRSAPYTRVYLFGDRVTVYSVVTRRHRGAASVEGTVRTVFQCALLFLFGLTVSFTTHKANADVHCPPGSTVVVDGRDFHHCAPTLDMYLCRSHSANGHNGWATNNDGKVAAARAVYQCQSHGGVACSEPTCETPGVSHLTLSARARERIVWPPPTPKHPVLLPAPERELRSKSRREEANEYLETTEKISHGQGGFRNAMPHGLENPGPEVVK